MKTKKENKKGAGHPTLSEQFRVAAEQWDNAVAFGEDETECAKKAQQLQKKIEARRVKLLKELDEIDLVTRSKEWKVVEVVSRKHGQAG